jgi:hypothetical protein
MSYNSGPYNSLGLYDKFQNLLTDINFGKESELNWKIRILISSLADSSLKHYKIDCHIAALSKYNVKLDHKGRECITFILKTIREVVPEACASIGFQKVKDPILFKELRNPFEPALIAQTYKTIYAIRNILQERSMLDDGIFVIDNEKGIFLFLKEIKKELAYILQENQYFCIHDHLVNLYELINGIHDNFDEYPLKP